MLAPLLIGVGLAVLLAIHQWKIRRDGLFDRHIFSKSRNPGIVFVAVAIEGAGTWWCVTTRMTAHKFDVRSFLCEHVLAQLKYTKELNQT